MNPCKNVRREVEADVGQNYLARSPYSFNCGDRDSHAFYKSVLAARLVPERLTIS